MSNGYRIEAHAAIGVQIRLYDAKLNLVDYTFSHLIAQNLDAGLYLLSFRGPGRGHREYVRVGPENPHAKVEVSVRDLAAPVLAGGAARRSNERGRSSQSEASSQNLDRLDQQLKAIYEVLSAPREEAAEFLLKNPIARGDVVISVRQSAGSEDVKLLEQLQLESYRGSVMAGTHFTRRNHDLDRSRHRPWAERVNNIRTVPGFATGQLTLAYPGVYRLRSQLGEHGRVNEQIFPVMWHRRTLVFTEYRRVPATKFGRARIGIDPSRTIIMTIPVTDAYKPEGDSILIAASLLSGIARNGMSEVQTLQLCEAAIGTQCPCIALYALVAYQLRRREGGRPAETGAVSEEIWNSVTEPLLQRALELPTPDAALMVPEEIAESYKKTWADVSPKIGSPPPMMAASWARLMQASCAHAGLAPLNGFLDEVSREIGAAGPWLSWTPSKRGTLPRDRNYLKKVAAAGRAIYEAWPSPTDNSVPFDVFATEDGSDRFESTRSQIAENDIALRKAEHDIVNAVLKLVGYANQTGIDHQTEAQPLNPISGDALDDWLSSDDADQKQTQQARPHTVDKLFDGKDINEIAARAAKIAISHYRGRTDDTRLDPSDVVETLSALIGRPPIPLSQDLNMAVRAIV